MNLLAYRKKSPGIKINRTKHAQKYLTVRRHNRKFPQNYVAFTKSTKKKVADFCK